MAIEMHRLRSILHTLEQLQSTSPASAGNGSANTATAIPAH
jgi:hypothetical protein